MRKVETLTLTPAPLPQKSTAGEGSSQSALCDGRVRGEGLTIRNTALNLLARREHTATELTRKLKQKNFNSEEIQCVIHTLQQEGLLSHQRFVESFIHARRKKGYGPLRIQAELLERGIAEELIEPELKIADNAWFADAKCVWQKKFKNRLPADFKTRAQHMRFLQYRGFTREQIESVFETL